MSTQPFAFPEVPENLDKFFRNPALRGLSSEQRQRIFKAIAPDYTGPDLTEVYSMAENEEFQKLPKKRQLKILRAAIQAASEGESPIAGSAEELASAQKEEGGKIAMRESLPALAGIGASVAFPPARAASGLVGQLTNLAGRTGATAVAGAGGEAGGQILDALRGEPVGTVGESAERMAVEGGIQGAFELGAGVLGVGLNRILSHFIARPSAKEAQRLIAGEISNTELSPAQTGKLLQTSFDQVKKVAGERVGQSIDSAARKGAKNPDFNPTADKTLKVISEELSEIEKASKASKEFSAQSATLTQELSKLQNRLPRTVNGELVIPNPQPRPAPPQFATGSGPSQHPFFTWREFIPVDKVEALKTIHQAKQDFSNAIGENVTRQARTTAKRVKDAADAEIKQALGQVGSREVLDYTAANARFGEVAQLGKSDVLKSVFGNSKVRKSPGKVLAIIRADEEAAIGAIKTLNKEGQKVVITDIQRAIFDDMSQSGQLAGGAKELPRLSEPLLKEVFGTATGEKVARFSELLNESSKQTLFNKIVGFMRLSTGGKSLAITDPSGNVTIITPARLRKLLDKPQALDLLVKGLEAPIDPYTRIGAKATANTARALQLLIRSVEDEDSKENK